MKKFLTFASVVSLANVSFAGNAVLTPQSATQTNIPKTSSSSTGSGIATTSAPSVNDASKKSGSNNSMGALIAAATGAMHFAQSATYAACCSDNPGCCAKAALEAALGAISMAQSGSNSGTAGAAGNTAGLTDGYGYGNASYDPNSGIEKLAASDSTIKAGLAAQKALNSDKGLSGMKLDSKTGKITLPNGSTANVADYNSPAAMRAAGVPEGLIKAAMDKIKKVESEAMKKVGSTGFDDNGGGGSGPSTAMKSSGDEGIDGHHYGSSSGTTTSRIPAATGVAGLSKDYNGDPIGVGQDNLFLMMNRRYKVKEKQDSFFSDAELIQK